MGTRRATHISAKRLLESALAIAFALGFGVPILSADAAIPDVPEALADLPVDLDGDGVSTLGDKLAFLIWVNMGGDFREALASAVPEGDVLSLYEFFASRMAASKEESSAAGTEPPQAPQPLQEWSCGGSASNPCFATLPDSFPPGTTIQQAINTTPDGNVLCIRPKPGDPQGIWRENVNVFSRQITLRGLPAQGQAYVLWAPALSNQRTVAVTDGVVSIQRFQFTMGGFAQTEGAIGALYSPQAAGRLCVEKCRFDTIDAASMGGAAIRVACPQGVSPASSVALSEDEFIHCRTFVNAGEGGGAVCILGQISSVECASSTFESCDANFTSGGAIYIGGDGDACPGSVTVSSTQVSRCSSHQDGGGMWIKGLNITLDGASIEQCAVLPTDPGKGGGVYLEGTSAANGAVEVRGSSFRYNHGGGTIQRLDGGGLCFDGEVHSLTIEDTEFEGNRTLNDGAGAGLYLGGTIPGGVRIGPNTRFVLNRGEIAGGQSGAAGGAVCLAQNLEGKCTFEEVTFDRNGYVEVPLFFCLKGGAIYSQGYAGPLRIKRSVFLNNQVHWDNGRGGAIFMETPAAAPSISGSISNCFFFADEGLETEDAKGEFVYVVGPYADLHIFNSTFRKVNVGPKSQEESEHIHLDEEQAPCVVRITNDVLWTQPETSPGNKAFQPDQVPPEQVHNCDVRYLSREPNWQQYAQNGSIDADPAFVSATDFHIDPGSPCGDAGTANSGLFAAEELGELAIDLDAQNRFWPVDIGADESRIVPTFKRADANEDGQFDVADPIYILSYLFSGGPPLACEDTGDGNDSGQMDLADPIYILNWLFAGGPRPPAPNPNCGPDPTPHPIGCLKYRPYRCQ